jgi:hypothetical protein
VSITALPWVVLVLGLLILAVGAGAATKIDERFWSRDNYCCRCKAEWHGIEKLCLQCGAPGQKHRSPEKKTPAFDWQGYMDTGPIPVVLPANVAELFEPRLPRRVGDRS